MKNLQLAIFAILCLSTSAWARTTPQWRAQHYGFDENRWRAPAQVVPNANMCAPDWAKAVWGRNGSLLGYRCWTNSNG
jgi:hypothetical protein